MNTRVHKKRAYVQRERAASAEETRARIVEATVALHEELGPTRTTISAIAERAGVQRLTVYRHFPDEKALFAACTGRWSGENPAPDAAAWKAVRDPRERTERALRAYYAYYRGTERMWTVIYRDLADTPAIRKTVAAYHAHIDDVVDDLAQAWAGRARASAELRATLRHAFRFQTWASLTGDGLDDARAARLAVSWARGVG
ncbi:MAG TPA: helix-turn-helix domain-containing protein [Rhodanobacteraceae bacterium]|nr:helix-turn-helix domain-containing protein [Rhodanobacteraceae bacterium]